ncbi:Glycosyltransferase involved in cell wall bisynthesis [Haloarcula vallismortis]|uniref:Glycosyltransferase n=2 Tax=Haloarcula vallismortis TaxID=28442 RepID=M0JBV8_HALVA|nr:glycosyltransferase [Haloarcula vallismortis]EMA06587.1 glycosyltransferase [Haloarcula vallismortis ATCC 29715]SDW60514.1 Glycosyltransferase involved in cell wall bisynthesis [Haloarcula vallismortis]
MKPTVAVLADKIVRGGGESLLTDIIAAIGDEVAFKIWCLGHIDDSVRPDFEKHDIEICRVRDAPYSSTEKYQLKPLPAVVRLLLKSDIDILHGYSLYCNVISRMASTVVSGTKSVGHHHGVADQWSIPRVANVLTNRLSGCTICVSETVAEVIYGPSSSIPRRVAGNNIEVVHNPIDFDLVRDSKQHTPEVLQRYNLVRYDDLIVSVGRLTESKNHQTLIRAAANMDAQYHFVIVGGGDLKAELTKTIEKYGVSDQVTLLGQVDRTESLAIINGADLFVSTSIREGFGIALVEAMALGKPIIASSIPAYREIGNEDVISYFQPRDAGALSDEIQRLSESPALLAQKIDAAQTQASKYSVERIASRYREIYSQLHTDSHIRGISTAGDR